MMTKLEEKSVEELEQILINRRKQNPHKYFIPNGKAEEFIKMVGEGKTFVCFLSGGNGTSKTSTGCNIIAHLIYGLSGNPYFNYPLFKEFPFPKRGRIMSDPTTIEGIIIPELKKWLPRDRYHSYKRGKNFESWWLAEKHKFDLMSYEQDVKEFESATLGWAWFDEPPPQAIFKATVARMRRGGIIFITATPLTGSAWLYDHIVAYQAGGNKEQRDFVFADVEDNCFANNTEILTENGWKDFESLSKSEIVATYNLLNEQLEYQSITGFIKKKWNSELIDIGLGLLATPNHRMVVLSDRNFRNKKPRIKEASGLYRGLRMIGAPKNVESRPFTVPFGFNGADWCEFLGWYLSEGCASGVNGTTSQVGKYQIYISQNEGEKKEIIKDLLQRMGLPVHERKGDIWFTNKEIHQYLIVLGNKYQKYIPREVFNYPKEWLARLWESLLLGDGDGKKRYVTTSKRLSDDIQEVLILLGYKSSLREWHPKTRGFNKRLIPAIQYCISANKRKFYHVNKIKTVFYDGMVYCVSVPNGTIVVRSKKEKYPLITGNCQTHGIRGFLQHEHIEKMIAEYSEDEKQARVHGKFAHLTGLVFKGFNRKVHVIKPFTITKKDYIVTEALDPHPRNPDAVMWMATNKNGDHIVCNELYGNYKTGELAERIKSGSKEYRVESRICDPSAFIEDQHQSDPKQQSLARRLYDLDLDYQPATKDRVAANRRIDDALYYEKSGNEMISAPELYIFDTCARTIWELEHYQWDDWRGKAAERKSPKETPQDKDDHMIENLGRLLLQEPEFISPPAQTVYRPVGVKSEESFDPFA